MKDGMTLAGRVLKVENRPYTDADGKRVQRQIFHVLADVEVLECQLTRDFEGSIPSKGEYIVVPISVRAFKRRGGDVSLAVDILGESVADEVDGTEGSRVLSSVG